MACSAETDVPGALSMGQCRCLTQAAELAPEIGRDLCEDIKDASGSDSIACHVRPSSVKLSRERAILLSLLVAELMPNASKHAFDVGQFGERHHLVGDTNAARLLRAKTFAGQRIAADLADTDGVAHGMASSILG
jgi:two-component sensor histidine kinase